VRKAPDRGSCPHSQDKDQEPSEVGHPWSRKWAEAWYFTAVRTLSRQLQLSRTGTQLIWSIPDRLCGSTYCMRFRMSTASCRRTLAYTANRSSTSSAAAHKTTKLVPASTPQNESPSDASTRHEVSGLCRWRACDTDRRPSVPAEGVPRRLLGPVTRAVEGSAASGGRRRRCHRTACSLQSRRSDGRKRRSERPSTGLTGAPRPSGTRRAWP